MAGRRPRMLFLLTAALASAPTGSAVAVETLAAAPAVHAEMPKVVMWPQHAREPDETAFLVVVEALIEWRTGFGDLLQSDTGLGHIVGALRQPLKRRARLLLIAGLARLQPLDA